MRTYSRTAVRERMMRIWQCRQVESSSIYRYEWTVWPRSYFSKVRYGRSRTFGKYSVLFESTCGIAHACMACTDDDFSSVLNLVPSPISMDPNFDPSRNGRFCDPRSCPNQAQTIQSKFKSSQNRSKKALTKSTYSFNSLRPKKALTKII